MISPSAYLEINLKNLIFNYKFLSKINKNSITAATIKANAYGLGDKKIFEVLNKAGCKNFFVATIGEALRLRKKFNKGSIYILNGIRKKDYNKLNKYKNIFPILNSVKDLLVSNSLKKNNLCIHFDTGINRLGLNCNEIIKIDKKNLKKIKMIISHYASADESANKYNNKQFNLFKKITKKYFFKKIKSINNSSGLGLRKKINLEMSRPGIAIYGGHNNSQLKKKIKPVVKLKAEIIQIKEVNKNEYIGYNQTHKTKKKLTIAILGIGYADGLKRNLSNKGYAYFKKSKFKIIGRVSMDTTTIDITNKSQNLEPGIFIDIINYENDVEKLAKICDTISNEILTSISNRVKRIYI